MNASDRIVMFADMLGFSALCEQHPERVEFFKDGRVSGAQISDSASRFVRFYKTVDWCVKKRMVDAAESVHAYQFSDCAFLVFADPLLAALWASALMRLLLHQRVPVRMGLAAGSVHAEDFTQEGDGNSMVSRALFYGTGVVRSNRAEGSAPGMRIFLHPSLDGRVPEIEARLRILEIPHTGDRSPIATRELCYLNESDTPPIASHPMNISDDQIWSCIVAMHAGVAVDCDPKIHAQYIETKAALNRMRNVMGRTPF